MGNYFGIFENGRLVAAAGERMQMNEYIELSGIVTHPDMRGRGYAKQLIAHTTNNIFNQMKTPFLHIAEGNWAITLYEKLGFRERKKIDLWNIARKLNE